MPEAHPGQSSREFYASEVRRLEQEKRRSLTPGERQMILDGQRNVCRARTDVAEVRECIAAAGIQLRSKTDPVLIARMLDRVPDVGLAAQAILLEPRPQWVRELIGSDLMKVRPRV